MQNGIVEFARHLQGPPGRPLGDNAFDIGRQARLRSAYRPGCKALAAIDLHVDILVRNTIVCIDPLQGRRSEEHTSELQSLMRISYAVFCLKKKKKNTTNQNSNQIQQTHN